ncbi:hypothetical protein JAAARDRAFT_191525 [Jaapia argillacea MUCL 33604]|uniref:Uncharacterized protein n=1 Tax=Jaapia argillacea MUCL 33604 TaxID=933084 RepID=A0A067QBY4_9AGAM|nr:hypothetical protein JAAARDRAFT_191525 [Jaapia argillacea MUCL 33604]
MSQATRRTTRSQKNPSAESLAGESTPPLGPVEPPSATKPGSRKVNLRLTIPPQQSGDVNSVGGDDTVTEPPAATGQLQKTTKKRGRAPSIPAQASPSNTAAKPPPAKKLKGSRSKKKAQVDQDLETVEIQDLPTNLEPSNNPVQPPSKPKVPKAPIPPHSPVPPRDAHPAAPGAPDMPRLRRTSEEVQKQVLAKAEVDAKIELLLKQRIRIVAKMEMADGEAEDAEDLGAIRNLADIEEEEEDTQEAMGGDGLDVDVRMERESGEEGNGKESQKKVPAVIYQDCDWLAPNWKAKAALDDGSNNAGNSEALGGLDDDDLAQDKPIFGKKTTQARENDFVYIGGTDSDDELDVSTPTPKQKPQKFGEKSTTTKSTMAIKPTPHQPKPVKKAPVPTTSCIKVESISSLFAPGGDRSAEYAALPPFAKLGWHVFLATLYTKFGSSIIPWKVLSPDDKHAAEIFVQDVVNLVWPNSGYPVKWGGPILSAAKDRIYDRRSQIGKTAITLYAVIGGPALWGSPAPQGKKKGDAGYVAPADLYYSSFVIGTLAPFLKVTYGALGEDLNPIGALALVAVAVERAFTTYYTGTYVAPKKFAKEWTLSMVNDQLVNVRALSPRRWKEI